MYIYNKYTKSMKMLIIPVMVDFVKEKTGG